MLPNAFTRWQPSAPLAPPRPDGPYKSEEQLGEAFEGRSDIKIATKWGPMFSSEGGIVMDGSPQNARACALGSLQRLRVSALDLFTMRGPTDPRHSIEETMQAVKVCASACQRSRIGARIRA